MSLTRTVARWIVNAATHRPPASLTEWGSAMRREFEELRGNELGWALGCAAAMGFARLRVERYYWAMLIGAAMLLTFAFPFFGLFEWIRGSEQSVFMVRRAAKITVTLLCYAPFPLAMLIGMYRPDRAFSTMLFGGLVMQHIGHTVFAVLTTDTNFFDWWDFSADLYIGPALVGLAASLGIWYAGARTGGWLAGLRTARA